jgi:PAS domain S-box-containing protein
VETALAEYLSHAPVFVRKLDGEIVYSTAGAQELYGFSAEEAAGRVSHELLQTIFPEELAIIEARLHADKQWRGRLGHITKDGRKIYTESLWRLRHADVVVEQIRMLLIV